jgi:hypothetical protein
MRGGILLEETFTCYSSVGVGQHRPDSRSFALGGGEGGLGRFETELKPPYLLCGLGVQITGFIPLSEEAPRIVTIVGISRVKGGIHSCPRVSIMNGVLAFLNIITRIVSP